MNTPQSKSLDRPLKVVMVTGSSPPEPCGVGDYTERLAKSLTERGAEVHVVNIGTKKFSSLPSLIHEIRDLKPNVVHIQYPTAGYGRSLLPFVFSLGVLRIPVFATLHEFSIYNVTRKLLFQTFALGCRARVFSNSAERLVFTNFFKLTRGQDAIIRIGSNIPRGHHGAGRSSDVVYFGLLMPDKGVEEFIEFADVVRSRHSQLSVKMVCAIPEQFASFAQDTIKRAKYLDIDLQLGLSPSDVADHLASSKIAYLPFPDGASEKRGSLVAAMLNEAVVMTHHTASTPECIRNATVGVRSIENASEQLLRLLSDEGELSRLRTAARECAKLFDWSMIADEHLKLYRSTLGECQTSVSDLIYRSEE
jgi:glycosyltransferase involved in cell wall biosynthesis